VNERYDEIVFFEPTEHFAYLLEKGPKARLEEEIKEMENLDVEDMLMNGSNPRYSEDHQDLTHQ
jgi:hypothetical protein